MTKFLYLCFVFLIHILYAQKWKKGGAIDVETYRQGDFKGMNYGWWFNWHDTQDVMTDAPKDVEFVPMIDFNGVANTKSLPKEATHLLSFNGVNHKQKANLTPDEVCSKWNKVEATNLRLSSPIVTYCIIMPPDLPEKAARKEARKKKASKKALKTGRRFLQSQPTNLSPSDPFAEGGPTEGGPTDPFGPGPTDPFGPETGPTDPFGAPGAGPLNPQNAGSLTPPIDPSPPSSLSATTESPIATPTTTESPIAAPTTTESPIAAQTTTESPTISPLVQEWTFDGDYAAVIGDKKSEFLASCSVKLSPVECVDVRSGSIIVSVRGATEDLAAKEAETKQTGLMVAGFAKIESFSQTTKATTTNIEGTETTTASTEEVIETTAVTSTVDETTTAPKVGTSETIATTMSQTTLHSNETTPVSTKRVSSPSTTIQAAPTSESECTMKPFEWIDHFFKVCPDARVEFMAVTYYGCSMYKLERFLEKLYNRYQLPIWITEVACADQNKTVNIAFMNEAIKMFEEIPYAVLERYAWYPSRASGNNSEYTPLLANSGKTSLGKFYSQAKSSGKPLDWAYWLFISLFILVIQVLFTAFFGSCFWCPLICKSTQSQVEKQQPLMAGNPTHEAESLLNNEYQYESLGLDNRSTERSLGTRSGQRGLPTYNQRDDQSLRPTM